MLAISVDPSVPNGRLVPVTVDTPSPKAGEVLIRTVAGGVNRPDALQRRGLYNPPHDASPLPGLEVSGIIETVGPDVPTDRIDEAVCALVPGGGYAEYVCCPQGHTLPIPEGMSMQEAAALPETVLTVWSNVFERAHFQPGQTVLIHGGNSCIGTTALQMIKALGGTSITTVRGADKAAFAKEVGADHVIDLQEVGDFSTAVNDITHGQGVPIILDMLGQKTISQNLMCLAEDGYLVQIAFLTGSKVEINIEGLMRKRQAITGSTLRPRSMAYKSQLVKTVHETIWPHVAAGRVKPIMDQTFPLKAAQDAHDYMESGALKGKIVLTVS